MFPKLAALLNSDIQGDMTQDKEALIGIAIPYDLHEMLAADPDSDECTVDELAAKILREHYSAK